MSEDVSKMVNPNELTQEDSDERFELSEVFLSLNLDKDVKILDVACGVGVVAEELAVHGYRNIDGLDPVQGYLEAAQEKHLYKVSDAERERKRKEFAKIGIYCHAESLFCFVHGFPTSWSLLRIILRFLVKS